MPSTATGRKKADARLHRLLRGGARKLLVAESREEKASRLRHEIAVLEAKRDVLRTLDKLSLRQGGA